MNADFLAWLASLTNDDGSGTVGDLLNILWFDVQMDTIDGVLTDIEADVAALQAIGFVNGYDSVVYSYTDADTITIAAGGQFTTSDSTAFISVAASTPIKISTGRSTDCAAEAANTLYYLWGGQTALGATAFFFHTSATAMPSELAKGKRIRGAVRNDNSSDLMPFYIVGNFYQYDTAIAYAGSDVTEVFDGTMDTNFQNVDCSGFTPPSSRIAVVGYAVGDPMFWRVDGTSNAGILAIGGHAGVSYPFTNASGIFEARGSGSRTTRISVTGYYL